MKRRGGGRDVGCATFRGFSTGVKSDSNFKMHFSVISKPKPLKYISFMYFIFKRSLKKILFMTTSE